ncbi:MAG: hypothetical protein Q9159_007318 [Coniocarpon cinnabarinum]
MGYPMAMNLRQKIQPEDELIIHDVNAQATARFKEEMGNASNIRIAGDVRQVAEQAVRSFSFVMKTSRRLYDEAYHHPMI